jgi:polysaccharide export outer membrane protein
MSSRIVVRTIVAFALVASLTASMRGQAPEYVLGAHDEFSITVWGPGGGTERFTVEADGTFTFPMLGRLRAGGLTVRQLQDELTQRLRDGYFKEPRVTVNVEAYQSQRIFIVGEVKSPGTYSLARPMTLVEALTLAGSTTGNAGSVALVRRRADGKASGGPVTEAGEGVTEIRADLTGLPAGVLTTNPVLRDGDTIAVPPVAPVYVFGHVGRPGEYTIGGDTSVRQLLSLAGGVTQRGAEGRIKIMREVDGREEQIDVELDDRVRPGDTVIVPERYF